MIFRQRPRLIERTVPESLTQVHDLVDGQRDVTTIARLTGLTQCETAKAKVCELFNMAVESIYLKLVMFNHSRDALLFENQLNRFARDNRLKVRMSGGRVVLSDLDTPIDATSLIDLYKLFIGIQNNKFGKILDPAKAAGLMEGLYRHTDPEFRSMMRMYEFYEIEGLLPFHVLEGLHKRARSHTG